MTSSRVREEMYEQVVRSVVPLQQRTKALAQKRKEAEKFYHLAEVNDPNVDFLREEFELWDKIYQDANERFRHLGEQIKLIKEGIENNSEFEANVISFQQNLNEAENEMNMLKISVSDLPGTPIDSKASARDLWVRAELADQLVFSPEFNTELDLIERAANLIKKLKAQGNNEDAADLEKMIQELKTLQSQEYEDRELDKQAYNRLYHKCKQCFGILVNGWDFERAQQSNHLVEEEKELEIKIVEPKVEFEEVEEEIETEEFEEVEEEIKEEQEEVKKVRSTVRFYLDFDGTLTGLAGGETIHDVLYHKIHEKYDPNRYADEKVSTFKPEADMVYLLKEEFEKNPNHPLKMSDEAVSFIKKRLSENEDIFIISYNRKEYVRAVLLAHGIDFPVNKITAVNEIGRAGKMGVVSRLESNSKADIVVICDDKDDDVDKMASAVRRAHPMPYKAAAGQFKWNNIQTDLDNYIKTHPKQIINKKIITKKVIAKKPVIKKTMIKKLIPKKPVVVQPVLPPVQLSKPRDPYQASKKILDVLLDRAIAKHMLDLQKRNTSSHELWRKKSVAIENQIELLSTGYVTSFDEMKKTFEAKPNSEVLSQAHDVKVVSQLMQEHRALALRCESLVYLQQGGMTDEALDDFHDLYKNLVHAHNQLNLAKQNEDKTILTANWIKAFYLYHEKANYYKQILQIKKPDLASLVKHATTEKDDATATRLWNAISALKKADKLDRAAEEDALAQQMRLVKQKTSDVVAQLKKRCQALENQADQWRVLIETSYRKFNGDRVLEMEDELKLVLSSLQEMNNIVDSLKNKWTNFIAPAELKKYAQQFNQLESTAKNGMFGDCESLSQKIEALQMKIEDQTDLELQITRFNEENRKLTGVLQLAKKQNKMERSEKILQALALVQKNLEIDLKTVTSRNQSARVQSDTEKNLDILFVQENLVKARSRYDADYRRLLDPRRQIGARIQKGFSWFLRSVGGGLRRFHRSVADGLSANYQDLSKGQGALTKVSGFFGMIWHGFKYVLATGVTGGLVPIVHGISRATGTSATPGLERLGQYLQSDTNFSQIEKKLKIASDEAEAVLRSNFNGFTKEQWHQFHGPSQPKPIQEDEIELQPNKKEKTHKESRITPVSELLVVDSVAHSKKKSDDFEKDLKFAKEQYYDFSAGSSESLNKKSSLDELEKMEWSDDFDSKAIRDLLKGLMDTLKGITPEKIAVYTPSAAIRTIRRLQDDIDIVKENISPTPKKSSLQADAKVVVKAIKEKMREIEASLQREVKISFHSSVFFNEPKKRVEPMDVTSEIKKDRRGKA